MYGQWRKLYAVSDNFTIVPEIWGLRKVVFGLEYASIVF